MRALFVALLVVAGCGTDDEGDFPVLPNGAGFPTPGSSSAGVIRGRVCVVIDPRELAACSTVGAANIAVSVGATTVTTAADGTFVIATPTVVTPTTTFVASGPTIVTSQLPFGPTATIPALNLNLFNQLLTNTNVTLTNGTGSVFATVVRAGNPVAGVVVTTAPPITFGPFFDGASATVWNLNETGTRGIVFAPGAVVGPLSMTFSNEGLETLVDGIPVIDGGITFETVVLP